MSASRRAPSRLRAAARKLCFMALTLALLAGLAELIAWQAGVETVRTDLFLPHPSGEFLETNRIYDLMRPGRLSPKKLADEYLVFLFGGSTTHYLGEAEHLTHRLQRSRPQREIKIINAGVEALNSSHMVMFAREAMDYLPDLLVIYSGNNEFLAGEHIREELGLTPRNAHFWLLRWHSYAWLARLVQRLGQQRGFSVPLRPNTQANMTWGRNFSPAKKKQRYALFEANLRAVIDHARARGVKVVLCTIATNFRAERYQSHLFYSAMYPRTKLTEDLIPIHSMSDNQIFKLARRKGQQPYVQHRLGDYYLTRKDYKRARQHYINAALQDLQPFRADTTINSIIRRVARQEQVPLADVAAAFDRRAQHGIPGYALVFDWCHPTATGYRILQDTIFETIKRHKLLP